MCSNKRSQKELKIKYKNEQIYVNTKIAPGGI